MNAIFIICKLIILRSQLVLFWLAFEFLISFFPIQTGLISNGPLGNNVALSLKAVKGSTETLMSSAALTPSQQTPEVLARSVLSSLHKYVWALLLLPPTQLRGHLDQCLVCCANKLQVCLSLQHLKYYKLIDVCVYYNFTSVFFLSHVLTLY